MEALTLYIWHRVETVSDNYHRHGSALAIAADLAGARNLLDSIVFVDQYSRNPLDPEEASWHTDEPTHVIPQTAGAPPLALIFPNAGCC